MTILLLGGNGLLGHNVLRQLLQRGHKVHVLVRNPRSLHASAKSGNESLLTVFTGSLLDDTVLQEAAEGCDAIVNCAGVTDMSLLHYEDYLPVNQDLCSRLVQLMNQKGITRLVHTSTANTIGYGTLATPANEQMPMQPPFTRSFYALSKRGGEGVLLAASAQHPEWHVVIVNPGFMVGAFDTKPSSGQLLLTAYRKPFMPVPKGGKSFIHVADAAVAIANAITMGRNGSRYLLTGENLTLQQFYRIQAQVCGYRQCMLPLPNWLLAVAGRLGDLLRLFGLKTQLSLRNVRQLMVCEYYDNRSAVVHLSMPQTPIPQAIDDFYSWYLHYKRTE